MPRLSYAPICDVCWSEVPVPAGDSCQRCGDLLDVPGQSECRACLLAPPPFERAVSFGLYRERMQDAIHALKYGRISPAARRLGRMLASAIAQLHGVAPEEMFVVPMPLHRRRKAERGFNQARMLARHALAQLRHTHPGWKLTLASRTLVRTKYTESQARLTLRQRRVNVRSAFQVSAPEAINGRHILLLDDILTTGATARAASAALIRAGAESVWVATLARARRASYDLRKHPQTVNPETGMQDEPLFESAVLHHPLSDEE